MKTLICLVVASCLALFAHAAEPALHTEVRIKETAERQFFCAKKELKLAEMREFAVATIPQLVEKATELKLQQGGPLMFTYFNFFGETDKSFTAETGVPIGKENAQKIDAFYVRKAAIFKCAAAIFQGPLSKLGDAWHSFAVAAMSNGEPTGESRELYLYWEGADSPNNIVELQMGLK